MSIALKHRITQKSNETKENTINIHSPFFRFNVTRMDDDFFVRPSYKTSNQTSVEKKQCLQILKTCLSKRKQKHIDKQRQEGKTRHAQIHTSHVTASDMQKVNVFPSNNQRRSVDLASPSPGQKGRGCVRRGTYCRASVRGKGERGRESDRKG